MGKPAIWLMLLLWVLAGCSRSSAAGQFGQPLPNRIDYHRQDGDDHAHGVQTASAPVRALHVVLVASELVVGPNRFAVGLLDDQGGAVHEATVQFRYFDLSDPQAPQMESAASTYRLQAADGHTTIFAHTRRFDRAGAWGVEVEAQLADGATVVNRIRFQVLAETPSVAVGERVPTIDTPTLADVDGDIRQLSSAPLPNTGFHQVSLADALTNGKPTLLLFATPAFCQTRFCGSDYEITSLLQHRHGDAFNFIHVEVYSGLPNPSANQWQLAPAMAAFGLTTEPWLYLIDAEGRVVHRIEGMFSEAEVDAYLQLLRRG